MLFAQGFENVEIPPFVIFVLVAPFVVAGVVAALALRWAHKRRQKAGATTKGTALLGRLSLASSISALLLLAGISIANLPSTEQPSTLSALPYCLLVVLYTVAIVSVSLFAFSKENEGQKESFKGILFGLAGGPLVGAIDSFVNWASRMSSSGNDSIFWPIGLFAVVQFFVVVTLLPRLK